MGECRPVIGPGAKTCTHRQQCEASFKDSTCVMTQCVCPTKLPEAVDGTCGLFLFTYSLNSSRHFLDLMIGYNSWLNFLLKLIQFIFEIIS